MELLVGGDLFNYL
jgi:calcium-dependent protein kinase